MGTYTKFTLVTDPPDAYNAIARELTDLGYPGTPNHTVFDHDRWSDDGVKWYTQDADTIRVSTRHPDVAITISGVPEDGDDPCWVKQYKNGLVVFWREKVGPT